MADKYQSAPPDTRGKNQLPWYKRYPRDFIEGTIGLPFEVKTTYSFLLDLIYLNAGFLPDDPRYIAGLLGVSVRRWNSIKNALIKADKISVTDGYITNDRAIIELINLRKFQDKQAENRSGMSKNKDLEKPRSDHPEPEPEEEKDKAYALSKKKARGSRLSEDWFLPREWGEWACDSEGMSEAEIRREADRFKDYWLAKSGANATKLDWRRTWQNWCRSAMDRRKVKNGPSGFELAMEDARRADERAEAERFMADGAGAGDVVRLLPPRR